MPRIIPNLWFDGQAEEAADFYCSVFPDSKVVQVARYPEGAPGPAGTDTTVQCEPDGHRCVGINGRPPFTSTDAVSLHVHCADPAEGHSYWEPLGEGG